MSTRTRRAGEEFDLYTMPYVVFVAWSSAIAGTTLNPRAPMLVSGATAAFDMSMRAS